MDPIEKIKDIILDNNYFDTLPGERFKEWNEIRDIQAVIAFAGRSKNRESYRLTTSSDSDAIFVTHLYIDRWGEVKVLLGMEDTDDYSVFAKRVVGEPIEAYDNDTIREWVELLTI